MSPAALFDLSQVDDRTWLGAPDTIPLPQVYGGQLVGQSVAAASRSVEMPVHSVHTTFLRGGTVGEPVNYEVSALTRGRSRATSQVDARQGERLLCRSLVSAAASSAGLSHARPAPDVAAPEDAVPLGVLAEADGGLGGFWEGFDALEVRVAGTAVWMRPTQPLPEDPAVHRAVLAYASDLLLLGSAGDVHGLPLGHERSLAEHWWGVSLDHTLWFATEVRADDWLLFDHTTAMAHPARTLIRAAVTDRAGRPVAEVAQEALIRRARSA